MEKILITGITGQDGLFLTSEILNNIENTKIYGTTRSNNHNVFNKKLSTLTNKDISKITLINLELENFMNVDAFISDIRPDQIYNLTGPSSVYQSLNDKGITYNQIVNIFDNLIKSINNNSLKTKFFQASSSEMFGVNETGVYDESSKFIPTTPYAKAKYKNHKKIINLYQDHDLDIFSGIMFNHESEFRSNNYLIMQIINSAKIISEGKKSEFKVGSIDLIRDWSFAGDVAKAIFQINNYASSNSYVIGSGKGVRIEDLIKLVFNYFNLDYKDYLKVDASLNRKNNILKITSNPNKINQELSWKASMLFEDLIIRCIEKRFNE